MAEATKPSFLGSITSWSRSSTPPPKSPSYALKEDGLRPSSGVDHTISLRPSPSLRRYPKDCPPLKPRWFYAVDVAKRKPFAAEPSVEEKGKPPPGPKKLVPFSTSDSQAIESAFQSLDRDGPGAGEGGGSSCEPTSTRVPVNEDYLFDVHIEKRELEPAYWLGPVYEVRRGSWFYMDGGALRPCDENLANQLEEGYLKIAPWRRLRPSTPRSTSQPRTGPSSTSVDDNTSPGPVGPNPGIDDQAAQQPASNNYRLFGAHMNTTVTYQDATVAYLLSEDFMSRMSSTVYGRFVGYGGTKVVRGWCEPSKVADAKAAETTSNREKRKSARMASESNAVADSTSQPPPESQTSDASLPPRRTALERQLSSLAGMPDSQDPDQLEEEEEVREREEREMEDAREKDGDDQARQIDHLVLVTHGIGQRLGLRLDSINFVHDVNTLRKTMKAVYESSPDLQALSGDPKNCKIQVLPICWRHLLDFPKQSLKQNRKEFDLGDADAGLDDEYPSLQDITVDSVPAVRNLITDLAMDVLLYQSAYREHIASIVQKESNRVYRLFKARTGFTGTVSVCGHSLGSAIYFDILCRQKEPVRNRPHRVSSKSSRDLGMDHKDFHLHFDVENFFALGSPIALFQMLKGRTITGRQSLHGHDLSTSPFDPDPMMNDPFDVAATRLSAGNLSRDLIPITTSSPKCAELFNIFHPTDPIAYRIEPLISPAMAHLKSQPLPCIKKSLFAAPGIANISARVGQQVMSSWYSLTSGVASSLINRSLGITGEEQALAQDKAKANSTSSQTHASATGPPPSQLAADDTRQQALADAAKSSSDPSQVPTLIDAELETLYAGFERRRRSHQSTESDQSLGLEFHVEQDRARKLKREEAKVRALNSNGRVDYHIQEGMFDVSLLASIASHLSYWADEDVNHFMIGQMLKKARMRESNTV